MNGRTCRSTAFPPHFQRRQPYGGGGAFVLLHFQRIRTDRNGRKEAELGQVKGFIFIGNKASAADKNILDAADRHGYVLTSFSWQQHFASFGYPEDIVKRLGAATVLSPQWNEYDYHVAGGKFKFRLYVYAVAG